jgi:hypothetical protein
LDRFTHYTRAHYVLAACPAFYTMVNVPIDPLYEF